MNRFRTVIVLLCLTALAGCSSTFLYNRLEWLVPWYVDDYVDLTHEQQKSLKDQVRPLLRWHRGEELARYLAILERIEADLRSPVSGDSIQAWSEALWAGWERIEERVLPVAFELGERLTDEQIAEFIESFRRKQVDLEREYLARSDQEYVDQSAEKLEERLHQFLGKLSPGQEKTLRTAAQALRRMDAVWLSGRKRLLQGLEQLLQREPGWQQAVRGSLAAYKANRAPEYRQAFTHNRAIIYEAIADVLSSRSEQQSATLQRKINELRKDLEVLIARDDGV